MARSLKIGWQVNMVAVSVEAPASHMQACARSRLAITLWSRELSTRPYAPVVIAVDPGSLLGSKMVKEGFGVAGTAREREFENASGQYYDNDSGRVASPHALDAEKSAAMVAVMGIVLLQIIYPTIKEALS